MCGKALIRATMCACRPRGMHDDGDAGGDEAVYADNDGDVGGAAALGTEIFHETVKVF